MISTLVDKQRDLKQREEALAMTETTKQTWAQLFRAEAAAEAKAQLEAQVKTQVEAQVKTLLEAQVKATAVQTQRDTLIALLLDAFSELPEPLMAAIRSCEDSERLRAAIRRTRTLTTLDELQF